MWLGLWRVNKQGWESETFGDVETGCSVDGERLYSVLVADRSRSWWRLAWSDTIPHIISWNQKKLCVENSRSLCMNSTWTLPPACKNKPTRWCIYFRSWSLVFVIILFIHNNGIPAHLIVSWHLQQSLQNIVLWFDQSTLCCSLLVMRAPPR